MAWVATSDFLKKVMARKNWCSV